MIITHQLALTVIRFRRQMLTSCSKHNLAMHRAVANEDLAYLVENDVITTDDHQRLVTEFQDTVTRRLQEAA